MRGFSSNRGDIAFSTRLHVRQAKTQISLRICFPPDDGFDPWLLTERLANTV